MLLLFLAVAPSFAAEGQKYSPRSGEEIEILSLVISSELKSNDWKKSTLVCFSVNGLDPSGPLVKSLRQRIPNLRSSAEWPVKFNCSFELQFEYKLVEAATTTNVRTKVIDNRDINSGNADIATILKDGEYSLQKIEGKWAITGYAIKPLR